MPEIKISELTSAAVPVGTEVLAIVQSNDTKKTTINSLASALATPLEDNLSTGAPTWTTDGVLTAGHDIIAGGNDDGRVALTINDGFGNANITFNHNQGIPDKSGSSARIISSVDSNQEVLEFQLKGSVTAGTPVGLTPVLKLYDDSIQLLKPTTLSESGITDTSLVNKGYIDDALDGKSDTGHTHTQYSLNTHLHDDRYSQLGHGHAIGSISNLQTILDGKIGEAEINTLHFTFHDDQLSLNTIQEGQIATDAITKTKIKDGAITTSKILVTGRSAALNSDPHFQDPSAWTYYSQAYEGTFEVITDGVVGNDVLRSDNSSAWYNGTERIPLDRYKSYKVSGHARSNNADGKLYIRVALFDKDGANIAGSGSDSQWGYVAARAVSNVSNEFTEYSGDFGFGIPDYGFPSEARTMSPLVILNYQGSVGYMEAQNVRIEEIITPAKLSTGAPNWNVNGTATLDNSTVAKINNVGNKAIATKEYVDSVTNPSAINGLLSIPLSSNYPSYYIQGTVISGSLTGVWSGIGGKTNESIVIDLKNISTASTAVSSFYTLNQNVADNGDQFSVTKTFTRANYTIQTTGLYQLSVSAVGSSSSTSFTTTSGATATAPA